MRNCADPGVSRLRAGLTVGLLVLLLSLPQVVLAQAGQGQIEGRVESDSGQVPSQVRVTIEGPGGFREDTVPDRKGYFRFSQLAGGTYRLESAAEGHVAQRREGVELQAGETVTINFRLLQDRATLRELEQRGAEERNPNIFIRRIDNLPLHDPLAREGIEPVFVQFSATENRYGVDMGAPVREIFFVRPEDPRNRFHASLYAAHENSSLNARPFFNVGPLRSSKRNQFGLSVSGPLIQDRVFFTSSLDFVQESGFVNGNIRAPLPSERFPTASDPATAAVVTALLQAFPAEDPNLPNVSARQLNTNAVRRIDSLDWNLKVDYPVTEQDHLAFQYTLFDYSEEPFEFVAGQNPDTDLRPQTFAATHVRTWSPATLVQSSFQFDRLAALLRPTSGFLSLLQPLGLEEVPDIGFGGDLGDLSSIGPGNEFPRRRLQNRFSGNLDVTHQKGNHQLRFGGRTTRIQINDLQSDNTRGSFTFSDNFGRTTVENFLEGTPTTFNLTFGDLYRGFRNWEHGLYLQDSYQIRPGFTLDLGLRYEIVTAPKEVNDRMQFDYQTDANNFGPHLTLAWSPGGGKTVVRAGYGISFGHVFAGTYQTSRFNPPAVTSISIQNPSLIDPLKDIPVDPREPQRPELNLLSPDLVSPYSHQYNLVIQRRLPRNLFFEVGYAGNRTHKPFFQFLTNRAEPVPGIPSTTATIDERRPDPNLLRIQTIVNSGIFYYDGVKVGLRRSLKQGLAFNVNYIFSKSMESNTSDFLSTLNEPGGVVSQDGKDTVADLRARSSFDHRHILIFQYSYTLPFEFSSGVSSVLLNGWQVAGMTELRSGGWFGASTSSDAPGFGNVDGEGDDRANILNPDILGVIIDNPDTSASILRPEFFDSNLPVGGRGNLGLSIFGTDPTINTNLALTKSFELANGERFVRLRAEFQNLFNHPLFERPGDVFPTDVFGKIVDTQNKGRVIQFMLRLEL